MEKTRKPELQGQDCDSEDIAPVTKKVDLFLVEDDNTEGAHLTSVDFAQDIDEKPRNVVIATCKLFPHLKWKKLAGNNCFDRPDRVVWHGLHKKTSEELSRLAVTAVICGTTIEVQEGFLPAMWKAFPLACDNGGVAKAFVGLSFEELKVIICVKFTYTTPKSAYGATKYVLAHFGGLKLVIKAGHCAGPYSEGTIVVMDRGLNPMKATEEVVCYDNWNQTHWPPKEGFPSSMMRDFSYRVSMNVKEALHFPYS
jgi:hypothetical protein